DPLGGINQLYPLFGTANQLLAVVALAVTTTVLVKSGRGHRVWVTGLPLAWAAATTVTAAWEKIFSGDPAVGFFAQRARYAHAASVRKVLAPAKSMADMHTVVVNSTVDGVVCAVFLLLVLVVLANAAVVAVRALRSPVPLPSAEAGYVPSRLGTEPVPVPKPVGGRST